MFSTAFITGICIVESIRKAQKWVNETMSVLNTLKKVSDVQMD